MPTSTHPQTRPILEDSRGPPSEPAASSSPPLDILEQIKAQVLLQKLTPYTGGITRDEISAFVLFHWRFIRYLASFGRDQNRDRRHAVARLSWDRLMQLNEDVNDEIFRKTYGGFGEGNGTGTVARPNFLGTRVELPAWRNRVRRRLSELAEWRFCDVVVDIAGELPHRIPRIEGVLVLLRVPMREEPAAVGARSA